MSRGPMRTPLQLRGEGSPVNSHSRGKSNEKHTSDEKSSPSEDKSILIDSRMSAKEIISVLVKRGCPDLTLTIDLSSCGKYPFCQGGLGDVYRGAMKNGTTNVAIKCLRLYDKIGSNQCPDKGRALKRVARELCHWSKLNHTNVLPLMGLAVFREQISMVSEWMVNGDLMTYVRLHPNTNRIGLCLDVCTGLSYIHAEKMIHGDLKAANVMVSRNGTAMITDFGSSQLRNLTLQFSETSSPGLSIRWAAPEILHADVNVQLSREADVYAYGMTALEAITGKVPYEGFGDTQVVVKVSIKRDIPARPSTGVSDELWELLKCCWTWEKSERIQIKTLKERLSAISSAEVAYETPTIDPSADRFEVRDLADSLPQANKSNFANSPTKENDPNALSLQEMADRARSYFEEGRFEEAESLELAVLAAQKRSLGESHRNTLQSAMNLSMTYAQQGRLIDAESLADQTLAAQQRVLSAHDPDTLNTMTILAGIHFKAGRLAKAASLTETALATQKLVLEEDHPAALETMANLATTYLQQGQLVKAEQLGVDLIAACEEVLGKDHVDTLRSISSLAKVYFEQGRLQEANELESKAMRSRQRTLGKQHPETLQSMANLATITFQEGQSIQAESLLQEVLEIRKRTLGEDHPVTLQSKSNVLTLYYQQGRLTDAEQSGREVVATRKRVLGLDHPETLQSMCILAEIYKAQGQERREKALMAQIHTIMTRE